MYDINLVKECIDDVIELAIKDREVYKPFLDASLEYAKENKFYIQPLPNDKLLQYKYTFYTPNAFEQAKKLCLHLYNIDPNYLSRYAKLITKIKYMQFSIIINERELVTIYNIHNDVKNIFTKGEYIDNYVININILTKLYSPQYFDEWDVLCEELYDNVIEKTEIINIENKSITLAANKDSLLFTNLINKFIKKSNNILIGTYAIHKKTPKRLQIISQKSFSENIEIINKILSITSTITQLKFVTDDRIKKLTIYYNKVPILDIFNSAQYELIPYIEDNDIKYGSIFVIMKFLLIDYYSLKILLSRDIINENYYNSIVHTISIDYNSLAQYLKKYKKTLIRHEYKYIGVYVDLDLIIKRSNVENDDMFLPYYPKIFNQ